MTSSDFKTAIQNNIIGNNTRKVLLNYNIYPGSIYKIDDIAVRIVDNLQQLQQATTISLVAPTSGDTLYIAVDSSSYPVRVVDRQVVNDYYLYSILTENQRVVVSNPVSASYYTDVLIEPEAGISAQILQDYSAIQGSIQNSRESQYIAHSDRVYVTSDSKTNPTNLYSILNNTATPAQVQDSNYTSTGWINGRYEGSKITTLTNHSTDPFVQGTFFEGAFFGIDVDDLYISEIAPSDLTYGQYFYSGELNSLRYTLEDTHLLVLADLYYSLNTANIQFASNAGLGYSTVKPLNIGELFRINIYTNPGFSPKEYSLSTEVFQMIPPTGSQQYFPYTYYAATSGTTYLNVEMRRGYNETVSTSTVYAESMLYKIIPTRVYNIKGSFAQPLTQGKMRVKGTTDVIYIGSEGFVVSGSTTDYI